MIHLNTAGQGRMPDAVRTVLTECVRLEDRFGPHVLEERVGDLVHGEVHQRLEGLLNTPDGHTELFTGGATAFDALVSGLTLGRGDRIWTTPYESAARLTTLRSVRDRTRCRIEVVPLRPDGDLDLGWMAAHIDDSVALVSVVHVPASRGIINPVEDIGRLLAPHRCLYAVDAAYSLGQLPVDVSRIGCHLLTGDGWRFLRGPRAVGFAYVAPRLREELSRSDFGGGRPVRPSSPRASPSRYRRRRGRGVHLGAGPPRGAAGPAVRGAGSGAALRRRRRSRRGTARARPVPLGGPRLPPPRPVLGAPTARPGGAGRGGVEDGGRADSAARPPRGPRHGPARIGVRGHHAAGHRRLRGGPRQNGGRRQLAPRFPCAGRPCPHRSRRQLTDSSTGPVRRFSGPVLRACRVHFQPFSSEPGDSGRRDRRAHFLVTGGCSSTASRCGTCGMSPCTPTVRPRTSLESHVPSPVHLGICDRGPPRQDR